VPVVRDLLQPGQGYGADFCVLEHDRTLQVYRRVAIPSTPHDLAWHVKSHDLIASVLEDEVVFEETGPYRVQGAEASPAR